MPLAAALGAALASLFLLGCVDETTPVVRPATALDTLVVAVPADAHELLAPLATSAFESGILDLIGARPLDADFSCGLKFSAELARSWQWSGDGLELDLELRDDLAWEDGTPVSAKDLALSTDFATDPKVASPRAEAFARLDPRARPLILDDHHVRYRFLERGSPAVMVGTATLLQVVPSHLLAEAGLSRASLRDHPQNRTAPLASGRWHVARREPGRTLVLEPNPGFPGNRPGLRRVIFNVIPDYRDRLGALGSGAADLVEGIQVADADALLAAAPNLRLARRGYRSMDYIGWNQVEPPGASARADTGSRGRPNGPTAHRLFGDVRVREALTAAIDVDALIAATLTRPGTGEVFGQRAVGTLTPEFCDIESTVARIAFSPDAARAALAEAGWTDSNGDGVVDRNGVDFRFPLLVPSGSPRREAAGAMIQAQLRAVGVDAQVELLDPSILVARMVAGGFDAAMNGWSSGLWPDARGPWERDSELNFTSFADEEAERLLRSATSEPDPALAAIRWAEFEARVYSQQPYTFLYWVDEIVAVDRRFENTRIDMVSPWHRLADWTVPESAAKYRE
jgi:peptide/nickel transport system substrate-binding protein